MQKPIRTANHGVSQLFLVVVIMLTLCSCTKIASIGWYTHYGVTRDELHSVSSVNKIKKALKSRNVYWRIYAAKDLGVIGAGAKDAIPELTMALDDVVPQVRWEAAKSLGLIGPGEDKNYSIESLAKRLDDNNSRVIGLSLYALSSLGVDDINIINKMTSLMSHEHNAIRRQAMISVCNTNNHGDEFIKILKSISSSDTNITNKKIASEIFNQISVTNKCSYDPLSFK